MPSQTQKPAESGSSKAEEILAVAQEMIQTRGYNGFSFRDIAAAVGVKSASIHYHFPTKGDLARAVAANYRASFAEATEEIARRNPSALKGLRDYVKLYERTLVQDRRLCLCGALGGEAETLPDEVRSEINLFFDDQRAWIAALLKEGQVHGDIRTDIDADSFAASFFAALEGAMIIARSTASPQLLKRAAEQLITMVTA